MSGPTYTYTADVPQGATPFNQTQSPILNNFRAIQEWSGVNHVPFNTPDYFGKHKFVSLEFQSSVPPVQTNELTMFCQATGSPNPAEIFITYPNSTTPVQLSDESTGTPSGTVTGTATQGQCVFPSGVKIIWGVSPTMVTATNTQIPYTIPQPIYTTLMQNSAFTPKDSGCNNTLGVLCNGYVPPTGFMNPVFYGYSSTSVSVTFDFFLMGS